MFWFINMCVFAFDMILTVLLAIRAKHMFKQRYPGLTIPKDHWSKRIITYTKMVITYFIPILNIAFAIVLLYYDDEICERTVTKVYSKCVESEEKTNGYQT